MVVENVIIETDSAGNGSFRTGKIAPDELTRYDFVIVAEEVKPHAFTGPDTINKVAGNRWEGHIEDRRGAVTLDFEGMKSLDIEKCPDSETDIRFIVNGESKGVRDSIHVEPPFPWVKAGVGVAGVAIATGFIGRWLDWW